MAKFKELNQKFLKMVELEKAKQHDQAWRLANQLVIDLAVWFHNKEWEKEDFMVLGPEEGRRSAQSKFVTTLASTYYCMARITKKEKKFTDALAFALTSYVLEPANKHVEAQIKILEKKKGVNKEQALDRSKLILQSHKIATPKLKKGSKKESNKKEKNKLSYEEEKIESRAYARHLSTKGKHKCQECGSDDWAILTDKILFRSYEVLYCEKCHKIGATYKTDKGKAKEDFIRELRKL